MRSPWSHFGALQRSAKMEEFRELQKFRSELEVTEITKILSSSDVKFRITSTAKAFNVSQIGALGGDDLDEELLLSVWQADYERACAVLEDNFLSVPIPDGHFLNDASDEELVEIVGNADDWSHFDVAHAKKIIEEREISRDAVELMRIARVEKLKKGKPASKWLLLLGWAGALTGGLVGIGIAWSLTTMRDTTNTGEYYTYDESSREKGRRMMSVSLAVFAILIFLWITRDQ